MRDKTSINVRGVDAELRNKFKSKAAAEGKTMTQKIIELIKKYVSKKV